MANSPVPLVFDDEEVIEDLVDMIFDFHEGLACSGVCYRANEGDERRTRVCGRIKVVLISCFGTIFGQPPEERFVDAFDQASVLAEHLAKDHPFEDGNKRTALVLAFSVLRLSGINIALNDASDPSENPYYKWIQDVVSGTRTTAELASALRDAAGFLPGD